MMRNRLFSLLLLAFITVLSPTITNAQRYYNSPLSRFNLGTLENTASVRSMGMGGTGIAMRVHNHVYESNPASYSAIDTNSFVFDFGLDFGVLTISNGKDKYTSNDLSFHHIKMAFPIHKKVGIGFGIVPYSNSYYSVVSSKSTDSEIGHNGEGGLTKVFTGLSANLFKGFSVGLNMNFLYGEIKRYNFNKFEDDNVFDIEGNEYIYLRGSFFDVGVQYEQNISSSYFAIVGLKTTFGNNMKSKYELNNKAYNEYTTNTITSLSDNTKATLPTELDFGLTFGVKDKLTVAADYISSLWKDADIKGAGLNIANSNSIRLGAEYIPDKSSYYNLLKRMEYRIGTHIDKHYLQIDSKQLNGYGVSIGVGIPMRKSASSFNIYADYSKKNMPSDSFKYSERFFTIGVSINLYDRWFIRAQYI